MLQKVGFASLEELADTIVPKAIRSKGKELEGVPDAATESEAMNELRAIASKNKVLRSMIGQGYYGTKVPATVLRNLLSNPAWYTAYTPYQAEISQGRLEMLLNFQTMVSSLTGLEIAVASLLDEGSAAGEALNMCFAAGKSKRPKFFVDEQCFAQTIGCVQTRGENMGVKVVVGKAAELLGSKDLDSYCGVLVQYPNALGSLGVRGHKQLCAAVHAAGSKLVVATDLLACTLVTPPGEIGADIAVGSAQRFGVPMFNGGPHAGFMSCRDDLKRLMPGRLIGVSVDSQGNRALRMALQTREQFIRREKATSNICTAQALLANAAAAYGVYHGPDGLRQIAQSVHGNAQGLARAAAKLGLQPVNGSDYFDTLSFKTPKAGAVVQAALDAGINLCKVDDSNFSLTVDETFTAGDAQALVGAFAKALCKSAAEASSAMAAFNSANAQVIADPRSSPFMRHKVFNTHHSETAMLRYLASLERRDISLRESMIPLGSCTMKLNAASEMLPITWPEFCDIHPFAPASQREGYTSMIGQLNAWLASITGFAAVSTQPNSGATGEFAGLLAIKRYHESRGDKHRDVCLIPNSAHGTNPASAVMAGMKVIGVKNTEEGNVDMVDLAEKVKKHSKNLSCLMVTYPSTYGKYEEGVDQICKLIHEHGGQVYMDGANMNAQLGLSSPGLIGADVCHLNLHKTFAIPHGGGGPGVGSIGVAKHLAPFLPGHAAVPVSGEGVNVVEKRDGQVAAAPFGSAGILPIPWMFIRMMGKQGMLDTSRNAMLNANYIAKSLENHYTILFRDKGNVAHEFIMDFAYLKKYGLSETDVAKRLCDYGFHAPTTSWPVHNTLMVEPTESESKEECDRFIEAFIAIRAEIQEVIDGKFPQDNNVLVNAPHTCEMLAYDDWEKKFPYSRKKAAFPAKSQNNYNKFWPTVSRVDNVHGDRVLVCSCESVEALEEKH